MNIFQNADTIPLGSYHSYQNNNYNTDLKITELTQKNDISSFDASQNYDYLFQKNNQNSNILDNLLTYNNTFHESIEPSIPSNSLLPSESIQGQNLHNTNSTYKINNNEMNELINLVNAQNSKSNNIGNENIDNYDYFKTNQVQNNTIENNNLISNHYQEQINENITVPDHQSPFIERITYPGPGQTPIIEINTSSLPSQDYDLNNEADILNPPPALPSTNIQLPTSTTQASPTLPLSNYNIMPNVPEETVQFGEYQTTATKAKNNFIPSVSSITPVYNSNPSLIAKIPEKRIVKIPKVQRIIIPKIQQVHVPSEKKIFVMKRSNSEITNVASGYPINYSSIPQPIMSYGIRGISQPSLINAPVQSVPTLARVTQISPILPQIQIVQNTVPLMPRISSTPNLLVQPQPLINPIPQYSPISINPMIIHNNNNIIGNYQSLKAPIKYTTKSYDFRNL